MTNQISIPSKALSYLISLVTIPLLLAMMYSAGLSYYHDYNNAFGIPFGLFQLDFNELLFLGGEVLIIIAYKAFMWATFLLSLCYLVFIGISFILSKLNINKKIKPASHNDGFPNMFLYASLFFKLLIIISLLFGVVIKLSSEYGEKSGNRQKNELAKELYKTNKSPIKNINPFLFRISGQKAIVRGFIIASNDNLVAIFTGNEIRLEKISNLNEIKKPDNNYGLQYIGSHLYNLKA